MTTRPVAAMVLPLGLVAQEGFAATPDLPIFSDALSSELVRHSLQPLWSEST